MRGILVPVSLLVILTCAGFANADSREGVAAAAVLSHLPSGRYACTNVIGVRAQSSSAESDPVRVTIDGFGELPGNHAIAPLPANWEVHLRRAGERWRIERVGIAEESLADALIAARASATRDALLAAQADCDRTELARQLSDKGFAIDITGDYARAEEIAELALTIARYGGGDDAIARAIWLRGRARDGENRLDEALADYREALRLAEGSGDLETVAASLVGIGTLTMLKGDDAAGASGLKSALDTALVIGNDHIAATALLMLGNRQQTAADFVGALKLYDDAAARAERCGDLLINAAVVGNSGLVYDRLNNYDLASRYLRRAIDLYRKAGNARGVIRNLRNLAEIQAGAGDLTSATATLREIDRKLHEHFDARVAAYCDVTRARIALWKHGGQRAERFAVRALRAARTIGDEKLTESAAQTMGNAHAESRHYAEALPFYEEAIALPKSTLRPLPDAEREARAIASIYGGTSQLLTGTAATESRFKSLAPQFRILHLATHGTFDNQQPMYSNVVLAPGGSEDGLLEAREWIGLGIRADLVVLSGCETGRGLAIGGEGVVGMSWALLAAGCPTAVVTQTDVPESAAALMIEFHRGLAKRSQRGGAFDPRAATEALRDAQLAMLRHKRYAEPFHWAGFMLIGSGW